MGHICRTATRSSVTYPSSHVTIPRKQLIPAPAADAFSRFCSKDIVSSCISLAALIQRSSRSTVDSHDSSQPYVDVLAIKIGEHFGIGYSISQLGATPSASLEGIVQTPARIAIACPSSTILPLLQPLLAACDRIFFSPTASDHAPMSTLLHPQSNTSFIHRKAAFAILLTISHANQPFLLLSTQVIRSRALKYQKENYTSRSKPKHYQAPRNRR